MSDIRLQMRKHANFRHLFEINHREIEPRFSELLGVFEPSRAQRITSGLN